MRVSLRRLVYAALIAAVYAALGLVLAPISFGHIQFRVAEALTILPVFSPCAIWGVTLGCAITNAVGVFTGTNMLGVLDIGIGTAATLVAAVMTRVLRRYRMKGFPVLATLPPVLVNAVVVGAEWSYVVTGHAFSSAFWGFAAIVGAGQFGACTLMGLVLYTALDRSRAGEMLRKV